MNKKVLIIGGTGFIGKHTSLKLVDDGYKVYIMDQSRSLLLNKKDFNLIKNHLFQFKLNKRLKKILSNKNLMNVISFMKKDKKNSSKKINLVLLKKIGKPKINLHFSHNKLYNFLKNDLIN